MDYPKYVRIDDKEYAINTDFRIAIECNQIAEDTSIGDFERALAIIYKLFGDAGIKAQDDYVRLLELAIKYLSCGKEIVDSNDEEPDMDFIEDMDYIEASFMSDYGIDLLSVEMHWWKFMKLMNGLSNSEMGNCCVLNRVRNLRNFNTKDIKDQKEREKIEKAKKQVALKKKKKDKILTAEQEKSMNELNKLLGL